MWTFYNAIKDHKGEEGKGQSEAPIGRTECASRKAGEEEGRSDQTEFQPDHSHNTTHGVDRIQ
jgi:hypothetical protein